MIAKNAAEAAKIAPDAVARMAADKLIRDTYQPAIVEDLDFPGEPPANPTEYLVLKDTRFASIGSGVMLVRRGSKITDPRMIRELLAANADIKPIK